MKLKQHHGRWLAAIFIIAALLRLYDLGGRSFWLDEAVSVTRVTPALRQVDAQHPPLYYMLLYYWMGVVGDGEAMTRLLSALLSVLNVGLLYVVAQRLFARKVALIAVALLAFSPLNIWYAQETRMYAPLAFVTLLMSAGLAWGNWKGFLIFFVALSSGLYLGYLVFPLWMGISAIWLAFWWQSERRPHHFLFWLLASTGSWLLYRPWWPHFRGWLENALLRNWMSQRVTNLMGLEQLGLVYVLAPLAIVTMGLLIAGLVLPRLLKRHSWRRGLTALVLPAFAGFILLVPVPRLYGMKRVLVTGWPLVILFVAWLVAHLRERRQLLVGTLLGLSLAGSLVTLLVVPKDDWRSATAYLEQHDVPSSSVWLDPRWNHFPYNYYRPQDTLEPVNSSELPEFAAERSEIWLIAERFPGEEVPSSPSEAWLDEHWELAESIPFYRLEVRHYRQPSD